MSKTSKLWVAKPSENNWKENPNNNEREKTKLKLNHVTRNTK